MNKLVCYQISCKHRDNIMNIKHELYHLGCNIISKDIEYTPIRIRGKNKVTFGFTNSETIIETTLDNILNTIENISVYPIKITRKEFSRDSKCSRTMILCTENKLFYIKACSKNRIKIAKCIKRTYGYKPMTGINFKTLLYNRSMFNFEELVEFIKSLNVEFCWIYYVNLTYSNIRKCFNNSNKHINNHEIICYC